MFNTSTKQFICGSVYNQNSSVDLHKESMPLQSAKRLRRRVGGTIGKYGNQSMIPIDKPLKQCTNKPSEVKIEMGSAAQQVFEQAVAHIKRQKGMKRKQSSPPNYTGKVKRRKPATRTATRCHGDDQFRVLEWD